MDTEKPKLIPQEQKPSLLFMTNPPDDLDILLDNDDDSISKEDIIMHLDIDDTSTNPRGGVGTIEISSDSISLVPIIKPYDKSDAQILGLASPDQTI